MSMTRLIRSLLLLAVLSICFLTTSSWGQDSGTISPESVESAIERSQALLKKGVTNYPTHRSCFSCHHQTLPLLAFSVHDMPSQSETFFQRDIVRSISTFTEDAFANKLATLRDGGEIGGRALTVAYALWTLDLAGTKPNPMTEAMVEYLLKSQGEDGAWKFHSYRPPAASSRFMTSAVAIYGLRSYAESGRIDPERLRGAYQRTRDWSHAASQEDAPEQEDRIGQLWLEHMLAEELKTLETDRLQTLTNLLWKEQRDDGGWSQKSDLESDAYATGQALVLLAQVSNADQRAENQLAFRRGIEFLVNSQEEDGSWRVDTRSKPVQIFFDNGDPHGKSQFISMMATSWAVAALKAHLHPTSRPLNSVRVVARLSRVQ